MACNTVVHFVKNRWTLCSWIGSLHSAAIDLPCAVFVWFSMRFIYKLSRMNHEVSIFIESTTLTDFFVALSRLSSSRFRQYQQIFNNVCECKSCCFTKTFMKPYAPNSENHFTTIVNSFNCYSVCGFPCARFMIKINSRSAVNLNLWFIHMLNPGWNLDIQQACSFSSQLK